MALTTVMIIAGKLCVHQVYLITGRWIQRSRNMVCVKVCFVEVSTYVAWSCHQHRSNQMREDTERHFYHFAA
jgi:hypothetical protein